MPIYKLWQADDTKPNYNLFKICITVFSLQLKTAYIWCYVSMSLQKQGESVTLIWDTFYDTRIRIALPMFSCILPIQSLFFPVCLYWAILSLIFNGIISCSSRTSYYPYVSFVFLNITHAFPRWVVQGWQYCLIYLLYSVNI